MPLVSDTFNYRSFSNFQRTCRTATVRPGSQGPAEVALGNAKELEVEVTQEDINTNCYKYLN